MIIDREEREMKGREMRLYSRERKGNGIVELEKDREDQKVPLH